jgi:hypothetical protein
MAASKWGYEAVILRPLADLGSSDARQLVIDEPRRMDFRVFQQERRSVHIRFFEGDSRQY